MAVKYMNVKVCYWSRRDESGITYHETLFYSKEASGWHCWAYTDDNKKFLDWMHQNMKHDYDATPRFNSGDPMITVKITNAEDASLFKLMFI
jgi:hypothetical protein